MGWYGIYEVPSDKRDYIRRDFGANYEVLEDAMVGSVYYGAVKHLSPEWKGRVFGVVVLTRIDRRDGNREFMTKSMDESMGPCEAKCPAKILNLLSPLEDPAGRDKHAADWRERCRNSRKKVAGVLKLEDGMRVSLPAPVDFRSSGSHQHFVVAKIQSRSKMRTVFRAVGASGLYGLRPHNKAELMRTEDWEAQQASKVAEAQATARTAIVETERELEPMF